MGTLLVNQLDREKEDLTRLGLKQLKYDEYAVLQTLLDQLEKVRVLVETNLSEEKDRSKKAAVETEK